MPAAPEVDAVILCGGLGTRLRSVISDRPKSMAEVDGRPFLEFLVDRAAAQGLRRFILCVGYKAASIERHFREKPGLQIVFSKEKSPLGTAGALKLCEPLLRGPVSLVMNGDSFCDISLPELLDFHRARAGAGAIAVVPAAGRGDAGFIRLGKDRRILSFSEKGASGTSRYINAGIYALDRKVFAEIPSGRPCSLERETFPALLSLGLYGCVSDKPLYDIGTPERLETFRGSRR